MVVTKAVEKVTKALAWFEGNISTPQAGSRENLSFTLGPISALTVTKRYLASL